MPSIVQNPTTCVVDSISYLLHPQVLGIVGERIKEDSILPVSVLSEDDVSSDDLEQILHRLVETDDVCTLEFTRAIVVKPNPEGGSSLPDAGRMLRKAAGRVQTLFVLGIAALSSEDDGQDVRSSDIPSGPYFLHGNKLHQAWRLYPDTLEAFVCGMIPTQVDRPAVVTFQPFAALSPSGIKLVPVPSRHYYPGPTLERPLSGERFCIKDIFDVAGTTRTLSSKPYRELYAEPATATAVFIEKLVRLGAIIVGKAKTANLSLGRQWVDTLSPFNPRADGYLDASGSSTGPASGLAGYPWLDQAVGEDTGGSIREIAIWQGLYSIRPTLGTASVEGVQPSTPQYDVLGFFARSLASLYKVASAGLSVKPTSTLPGRILVPLDFLPADDPVNRHLLDLFVGVLEDYLGIERTDMCLADAWKESGPAEVREEEMQDWMRDSPFLTMCRTYWDSFARFRADYKVRFGSEPYVEPDVNFRWGLGKQVTDEQLAEHLRRNDVFRSWFAEQFLSGDGNGSSNSVMVIPYGKPVPVYREEPAIRPPPLLWGITKKWLSPVTETPTIMVPFAQVPYLSRVSGQEEFRTAGIGLMGAKGSDLMLIRLLEDAFNKAGWRTKVDVGRMVFPLGDGERHVDDSA